MIALKNESINKSFETVLAVETRAGADINTTDATSGVTPVAPELLAPAGNHDALLAALKAGADAVYLGVEDFNARRNAHNFELASLHKVCDLVHLAGKRVYLTLNTLVLPDEMQNALSVAHAAWEAGVDALIVQDLGLLTRLTVELPQLELHASTQMNLHTAAAVEFAAKLGVSRVTLSRELSLKEITSIVQTGVPLEVFAHGALCVCYSGQCLFSSLVGRRSANRGLCAQACRLPYNLIDTSTGRRLKTPGEHLLSPADLATLNILPQLAASGICSLKIEGRMKSAAYVATVTRIYREALDTLFAADKDGAHTGAGATGAKTASANTQAFASEKRDAAMDTLAETFSRGFTTAYLEGKRGNSMMSYTRPNNQGVAVGRVSALEKGLVALLLTKRIVKGDVLEMRTSRGRSIVKLENFWSTSNMSKPPLVEAEAGTSVYLRVADPVSLSDRVFRVRSVELLDKAEASFDNTFFQGNNGLVEVSAEVIARLNQPLCVRFFAKQNEVQWQGEATGNVLQCARTKALSINDIREHIGRVGGTPFSIASWDIQLDEGVGLGFSELHKVRATALDNLTRNMLAVWKQRRLITRENPPALAPANKGKPKVAAIVCNAADAKAAVQGGAELLYLHSLRFEANSQVEAGGAGRAEDKNEKLPTKVPVVYLLPAITHDDDLPTLLNEAQGFKAAVANNLAEIALLGSSTKSLEAGSALGIANAEALDLLARNGVSQAWLSPELCHQDIARISPGAPLPLALTIVGKQEVMVTEHCVLMAQGPCDRHCISCTRRKAPRLLEDRKGYHFPVRTDDQGRSHIFNAVSLDLVPSMPELVSLGISTLVVDGTLLTTKELKAEVERAVRARELAVRGAGSLPKREGYTTGHFFRGVH